uniref:Uncharacterized protein n=1 Tax=Romanomermis culicivorax TaxID=13658 RepID=A0A915JF58_ROMCU
MFRTQLPCLSQPQPVLSQTSVTILLAIRSSVLFLRTASKTFSAPNNFVMPSRAGVVGEVFDRGEFNECGHFTQKNYRGYKQTYFNNFLDEEVFDREEFNESLSKKKYPWQALMQ